MRRTNQRLTMALLAAEKAGGHGDDVNGVIWRDMRSGDIGPWHGGDGEL